MKRKKSLKVFAVACCLLLCMVAMTVQTFGYAPVDTERETSLTLTFGTEETVFCGVKFRVYRIADVSAVAEYTLTAEFADSAIPLQNITADAWQKNVETLMAYIEANDITPLAEETTDADGIVTFAGLQPGLYLVAGKVCHNGVITYKPISFITRLPVLEPGTDTWDYDVVAKVKYTMQMDSEDATVPQTEDTQPTLRYIVFVILGITGTVVLEKKEKCQYNYK